MIYIEMYAKVKPQSAKRSTFLTTPTLQEIGTFVFVLRFHVAAIMHLDSPAPEKKKERED